MLFKTEGKKPAKVSGPVRLDDALMERLERLYDTGVKRLPDAASWYDDTLANIQGLMELDDTGEDSDELALLFVDLLAATSPQTSIIRNTFLTTQIFSFINDAILCSIKMAFEAHLNNICRALLGLELSGQKVRAFQANLLGDQQAVTVDVWMMRAFQRDGDAPTAKEYDDISAATRKVAKQFGVSPAQMQAALWVGIKAAEGDPSDTPEPFERTLERFRARQDAQGALDFAPQETKFKDTEAALARHREIAANPGEGFNSPPIIGQRLQEMAEVEGQFTDAHDVAKLICEQSPGRLMAAILFTREHIQAWRRSRRSLFSPAQELEDYLDKEFER